ncbi:MAG: hypothetical protein K2L24_01165 [Opitutales bacterium]|nr:hypothetical protein [Opitutales bacterium]
MNRSIIYAAIGACFLYSSALQGAEEKTSSDVTKTAKTPKKSRFGGREIHVIEGKSTRQPKRKSKKAETAKHASSESKAKSSKQPDPPKSTTPKAKDKPGASKSQAASTTPKEPAKSQAKTTQNVTPKIESPASKAKQEAITIAQKSSVSETKKTPDTAVQSTAKKENTQVAPVPQPSKETTAPSAVELSAMKDSLKASIKESLAEILAETGLPKLVPAATTPKAESKSSATTRSAAIPVPHELTQTKNRQVSGDSDNPIIDLTQITTVNPMMLADGDPADLLPWKESDYYHFAKNQSLKELVRSFCSAQSVDVIVSDAVNDVVNGKFSNVSARQFWKDIVSAYGLVWFYDGSLLYVYKSGEIQSKVLQMGRDEMRTLIRVITQLGYLSSNINFRPMETAGILVVSGPPKLMEMLEELISKVVIERVSDVYDIRTFPLKHAWAYDMSVSYRGGNMNIPGVASMLQQIIGSLPGPVGEANLGMNIGKDPSPSSATPLDAMVGPAEARRTQSKESKDEGSSKDTDKNTNSDKPSNVGDIFITYDTRLNAVIVKAKHQDMRFIEQIIEQLDVPREAIRIDVAVVDISRSGVLNIGSKFEPNIRKGKFSFTENYEKQELNTRFTINLGNLFRNFGFEETLDILEDVGNAQTLTRSSVITLDNIAAVVDSSHTMYVKVSGQKAGDLFDVSVSTKLVVVPHIVPGSFNEKGAPKIKLLIDVSDGKFNQDPTEEGGSTEPKTDTNTVNTEASIYVGQSLFIGGYFHEIHKKSAKGLPFFKDIPLLGHLFKASTNSTEVMERVYIITPTLVDTTDSELGTYDRFFQDSRLSGETTLDRDEFNLTKPYKSKKDKIESATFERLGKEDEFRKHTRKRELPSKSFSNEQLQRPIHQELRSRRR